MTEVLLNGQRAVFKEDSNLKLNIENTFFEDSGSYTLDVTFPLDIWENRQVFGPVGRMDVTKQLVTFDAAILVGARLVFKGTARITNVNEREVKLQMLSGNSGVKFRTKAERMYIDEFRYDYTDKNNTFDGFAQSDGFYGTPLIKAGTFPGRKGIYCYVPTLDEGGSSPVENCYMGLWNEHHLMISTDDQLVLYHGGTLTDPKFYIEINRQNISPNLMFVTRWILNHLGYKLNRNDRNTDFINAVYIATARNTTTSGINNNSADSADEMAMAKALPHWTVWEFIIQMQNFLNATFVFDDISGTVDIIGTAYTDGTIDITADVEDEYEAEVIDDEDVQAMLYDSNVKYKRGEGEHHNVDLIERDVLAPFKNVECDYATALRQFNDMAAEERNTTVWTTSRGQFCAALDEKGTPEFTRINHFGPIVRNTDNENDVELKISPVATTMDIAMPVFEYQAPGGNVIRDAFNYRWTCKQTVVCLQNQYEAANKPTVWDAIQGTQQDETEKEDIMQVFLMDDVATCSGFYYLPYQMPFTHFELNVPHTGATYVPHRQWSLALANDNAAANIARLHQSASRQNRNAEHRFRFKATAIPSVYAVFLVRNKRYACKKLEVQFTSRGMEDVITGYFEEIVGDGEAAATPTPRPGFDD